jgi:chemotaxis signal transduction protein/nucleoid-associated protein YgaU
LNLPPKLSEKTMDKAQHDNSFLTFRVGPYHLAVPAVDAESIIIMPKIRSVPLTPDSVAGVFSHRGKIAVVISLKRKFGLNESTDEKTGQLIISKIKTGLTGFKVDEVLDIIPAVELNFSTLPEMGMVDVFNKFAVKNDEIILHTDFELLFKLKDSKELIDSLRSLTSVLAPNLSSKKSSIYEDVLAIEKISQTIPEEELSHESSIDSTSLDASDDSVKPLDNDPDKTLKQKSHSAEKKDGLKHRIKTSRQALPYRARPLRRKTWGNHQSHPSTQKSDESPKKYLWFAACGILILGIISIIWLGFGSDQALTVASVSEKTSAEQNRELSVQSTNLSQIQSTHDNSNFLAENLKVLEDKESETFMEENPEELKQIPGKADAKIFPTAETKKTDDLLTQESKEILRIDTDDFTMTIERPQTVKTETKSRLRKNTILQDKGSPDLKLKRKQPVEAELTRPKKTAETNSMPATVKKMEMIHIVVKGDTLWDISAKYLGDPFRYPELAKLSRINDPDLIYPGDVIRIIKKKQLASVADASDQIVQL